MANKRRRFREFLWRHAPGFAFLVMLVFVLTIGYIGYTYVLVTRKFDSSGRWDLPSRVYSDAALIQPGLSYNRALLEPKLNHVGYHEVKERIANPGEYRFTPAGLEIYLQSFEYPDMEFRGMPVEIGMKSATVTKIKRLEDGIALRAVRIEPELITSIYDDVMEDRVPVPLSAVPKSLVDAIISTEDRGFFTHEGISVRGIVRAVVTNFRSGARSAGGSTLTQQLVKNLYLNPERTFRRKAVEALMALILEARYSKNEILEAYLNEIYLGQNGSVQIVGVEQASQVYFSKRVSYLTLPEAATLAGMIRSPNVNSPIKSKERATERRNLILTLMRDQKRIDEDTYARALQTPMTLNRFPRSFRSAPFFVDLVMKQLRETYPLTQLETEGLRIFTTLDTIMQRSAEKALDSGVASLTKKHAHIKKSPTPLEGVVLTIQPGTGYVKALVGGQSYKTSQFNRAFQARRQPGSLFKPFVYVAAMDPERGQDALTASTILNDSPITIPMGGKSEWRPQNYDGRFHGPESVRRALALSYNIPAVRAAINAGVPNVIKLAAKIGVDSPLEPYPSISLGSFEVSPLEIAYAYSVFANEGVKAEPISILAVVTRDGKLLENREVKMQRVASPGLCYVMNDMLKDVLQWGTAARVQTLGFTRPFAGKTGTTNNYRDAWFIAYSPRILTLVWVGFDDGHNVRLSGSEAAVPIWVSHMNRIVGMVPDVDFHRPDDVVERAIDPTTNMLASPYCPETRTEVYVSRTEPRKVCSVHSPGGDFPFPILTTDGSENGAEPEVANNEEDRDQGRKKKKKEGLRKIFGWIFE